MNAIDTWSNQGTASFSGAVPLSAPISNYEKIAPTKTKYAGICFQSKLEASVARAMDRLGIVWKYERAKFLGDQYQGGQHAPDFRLPNEHIYIEAVGRVDIRHRKNAMAFCESEHCVDLMVIDEPPKPATEHPAFCFVLGDGMLVDVHGQPLSLLHCEQCNRWSVVRRDGGWICMHCGEYIGEGGRFGDNYWDNIITAGARVSVRGHD